ncbi:hypothetical protein V1519DRAFT_467863 [Lipomyces tetrasporus]
MIVTTTPGKRGCYTFHHQPAVIQQLLGKFYCTLHVAKKEAPLSRAVRDLKHLLIVLVPSCSRRKCLQEVIHRSVPDVVRNIRCISNAPPQSTSPESSSPRPWGTICAFWPSPRAPFPSSLCSRRPPKTTGPTVGNWFRPPFLGVAGGRRQPQPLTDLY